MKILANRNSVQGMVTYYVSLFGFVGSCIAITRDAGDWALAGFILALLVTILQDIHWYRRRRAHPHDLQLVEQLTRLLQETKTDLFLGQHDFEAHSYDDRELAPLITIEEEWVGVDYEFVSPELQSHWVSLRSALDEFTSTVTGDVALRGAGFYHLFPASLDPGDPDLEQKQARARRATALARKMFEEYQQIRLVYLGYRQLLESRI